MTKQIVSTILLLGSIASAGYSGVYSYDTHIPKLIADYQNLLSQPSPLEIANKITDRNVCAPVFKNAIAKKSIDVRYALGYFDDSRGGDIIWENKNWGPSASLDGEIYFALHEALIKNCEGERMTCGFRESGDPESGKTVYKKSINLMGSPVEVSLTLTHASASYNYQDNITILNDRQKLLTLQSEENFFGGLEKADIVFYNGHSRNGGGPDFNPPVLNPDGHPNYAGYYKIKRPGIRRALQSISKNSNPGFVYGSFSCFSASHFQEPLMKVSPKLRMVLSSDEIDYFQSLQASIGYLEGLLQGRCGEDLAQFAKRDTLYQNFKGINIR